MNLTLLKIILIIIVTFSFLLFCIVPNLDIEKFQIKLKQYLDVEYNYSSVVWRLYVLSLWYNEFKL